MVRGHGQEEERANARRKMWKGPQLCPEGAWAGEEGSGEEAYRMRIAIASDGKDLSSNVSSVFGRCDFFLIVEIEGDKIASWKAVKNNHEKPGGAGICAAKIVAQEGVVAVIAGKMGPKALDVLKQFGIEAYFATGSAKDAIDSLLSKKLERIDENNHTCGEHRS